MDDQPLRFIYRRPWVSRWAALGLYLLLVVACIGYGYGYGATAPFLMTPMLIPQALLAALIIWALPAGDYAPVAAMRPLFFLFFAALELWPNYLAIDFAGLPWVTLTRLFATPLTLVLLVCISVSKSFRQNLMACLNADPAIWKAVLLLFICETVAMAFSDKLAYSMSRYILAQTNWTAIFVVSCVVFQRPGVLDFWSKMFFGMGIIICVIGLWEWRLGTLPWAAHIPSFLKIEDESVMKVLAGSRRAATGIYRVQSTSTTSLGLSEILGLTAPFALHFAIGRYPVYLRLLALVCIPLFVFVILLTDSRLGVVSCFVAIAVYLLVWSLLRWRQIKDSVFAPALVFSYPAFFCVLVASTFLVGKIRAKVWGGGAQAASNASREDQWMMAIPKVLGHPLGHGMARSGFQLGYRGPSGAITVDSYYITILMDLGIIGFIAYFFIFLRAAWSGGRALMDAKPEREISLLMPLSVCVTNFVVVKSVFSEDGNHPLVFMMVGAIVALIYRIKQNTALSGAAVKA